MEFTANSVVSDQRLITRTCCSEKNLLQLMEDFEDRTLYVQQLLVLQHNCIFQHPLCSKAEVSDQLSITRTQSSETLLQLKEERRLQKTQNFMFRNYWYFNTTVIFNTHSAVKLKYCINNRLLGPTVRKKTFYS